MVRWMGGHYRCHATEVGDGHRDIAAIDQVLRQTGPVARLVGRRLGSRDPAAGQRHHEAVGEGLRRYWDLGHAGMIAKAFGARIV
jgi:hypothetical protein